VARDRLMARLDSHCPGYGFASHVGYGTKAHLEALATLGPSIFHRRSFGPIRPQIGRISG
jgi:ribonuclease HII